MARLLAEREYEAGRMEHLTGRVYSLQGKCGAVLL